MAGDLMTAYSNPNTTKHNIKDRRTITSRRDPAQDPEHCGWQKPIIGRSIYYLDCDRLTFKMRSSVLINNQTGRLERVRIVYPFQAETGQPVGEPIVYDQAVSMDTITDDLIDMADQFEALLGLIQLQHYEARLLEWRAYEADVISPPPSKTCPDGQEIPY